MSDATHNSLTSQHDKGGKAKRKSTLRMEFTALSVLLCLSFILIAVSLSQRLYNTSIERLNERIRSEAIQLDNYFHDTFTFTSYLLNQLGRRIVGQELYTDPAAVLTALNTFNREVDKITLLSVSRFSWADTSHQVTISGGEILDETPSIASRQYIKDGIDNPWVLHFAPPAIGVNSGQRIIPGGMVLTDDQGRHVGSLVMGFSIDDTVDKIRHKILYQDFEFALVDQWGNVFAKSNDIDAFTDEALLRTAIQRVKQALDESYAPTALQMMETDNDYLFVLPSSYHAFSIAVAITKQAALSEFFPILQRTFIELLLAAMLLVFVLLVIRLRFIKPIMRLSSMAEEVSTAGSSSALAKQKSAFASSYEIMNLAQQFDRVRYVDELERIRKELTYKARQSEARKTAAELASKAKSEMLTNMSHELRTPLNAILAFSETMRDEMFGPIENEKYKEYANDIHSAGTHLLHLINDILDLSKAESGQLEITVKKMAILPIAEEAVEMVRSRAEAKQITITLDHDATLPPIMVNRLRMKQIILNLLTNAVKFTPEEGQISVRIWVPQGTQQLHIMVRDNGIGMKPEDIPRALERFVQVKHARLDEAGEGTGLGLPLAKKLTELQGGEFDMQSAPNEGTTIIMQFPVATK